jgi:tetratricopeptide (TPR) repeat protein
MTEGLIHSSLGDKSSLQFYEESLSLAEEVGNKELAANAMEKIGSVHFRQGNVVKALGYLEKSLKLNEELKNKRQIIFTSNAVGRVHLSLGIMRVRWNTFERV